MQHVELLKCTLLVKFTPKYFSEMLNILLTKEVSTSYINPFTNANQPFPDAKTLLVKKIIFLKNKKYGFKKTKKKGIIKRKILRKVFKNNSITD
jgi:hypothetical protein